ncbi:hypothetical protein HYPSUDRAFT_208508 [Hypholoma sublateritium FD-334 SS-4]|uniref:Uncharacterized protein n=1 Tax=Hypholoma sublateritium (strain FD-334 SS-4) TaxID=945553 RepID=A0A0D2N6F7_HYPSF|nr:hypothetical protein HYPSUDRAFT_208508 [Hypholoma sublateritium FD-334 SS-4]
MLLVACPNGLIYKLSFDDPGDAHDVGLTTRRIINLREECFLVDATMTHIAMNEAASEITAFIGTRLLTYGEPFSGHYTRADVYRECIPDRLVGQSPLQIWYVDSTHVAIVYSTSIFVYIPVAPYLRVWMIDIPQARALVSATLSPDKTLLVGLTQSGQADVYSMTTRRFVSTIGLNQVSLHGLATAAFFNWDKILFSRDDETSLLVAADVLGPVHKLSKFVPFTRFDPFRIMGSVTRPYIADPANLNVVGLIVPDNFQTSDEIIEGIDDRVNKNESEVIVAQPAKPTEPAKLARFSFTQAAFVMHGDLESEVMMGIDLPAKIQELRLGRRDVFSTALPQTPNKSMDNDDLAYALETPSKPAKLASPRFPGHLSASKARGYYKRYEDLEIAYERPKPKLLSLIRAVVPDPIPEEKVEVLADLVLAAWSLDEIEAILVTLRSELPLLTILTRVSDITNITHDQRKVSENSNNGVAPKGEVESAARHGGRIIHYTGADTFQVPRQRQSASYNVASYSASTPRSRATSVVSRADIDVSEAASGISHAANSISLAASKISDASKTPRRNSLAASEISYAPSNISHGRRSTSPRPAEEIGRSPPLRASTSLASEYNAAPQSSHHSPPATPTDLEIPGFNDDDSSPKVEEPRELSAFTPDARRVPALNSGNVQKLTSVNNLGQMMAPVLMLTKCRLLTWVHQIEEIVSLLNVVWDQGSVTNSSFTGSMYWTMSNSDSPLRFEDLFLDSRAVPGHIHIHNNNASAKTPEVFLLVGQTDFNDRNSWTWCDITSVYTPELIVKLPFVLHPLHPDNALKLDENYVPSEEETMQQNATAPRLFSPPLPPERVHSSGSLRRTPGPHRRLVLSPPVPTSNLSARADTRSPEYLSEQSDSDEPDLQKKDRRRSRRVSDRLRTPHELASPPTPPSTGRHQRQCETNEDVAASPEQRSLRSSSKRAREGSAIVTAPSSDIGRRAAQPVVVHVPNSESDEYSTERANTPTRSNSVLQYSARDPIATKSKRMGQVAQRSPETESRGHLTRTPAPAPILPPRNEETFRIGSPSASRGFIAPASKGKRREQLAQGPPESESEGTVAPLHQIAPSKTVPSPSVAASAFAKGKRGAQTDQESSKSAPEREKPKTPQKPATPPGSVLTSQTPASKGKDRALSTTQSQLPEEVRPSVIASASQRSRASPESISAQEIDLGDDERASVFSSVSTRHQKPARLPKLRILQDLFNAHGPVLGRGVRRLADVSIKIVGKKEAPVARFAHSQIHFADTIWTVSDWSGGVVEFDIIDAAPGDIHFHRNRLTDSVDIWMRTADPVGWKQCTDSWLVYTMGALADLHPLNSKYILDASGDTFVPYYITASTYKGRKRKDGGLVTFNATSPYIVNQ